ncbi:Uncharacterised protein [Staphylococcus argenteus]|nr:Uncharacterised protein [Staphylococcus argenteus]SGX15512.1 Uncharacterised protein [Staphylococcus argenteus]SHD11218.1 Uncharacterised protein [Staphylococcus argenteus]
MKSVVHIRNKTNFMFKIDNDSKIVGSETEMIKRH